MSKVPRVDAVFWDAIHPYRDNKRSYMQKNTIIRLMQNIIKAEIYYEGGYYCAKTMDIDVFTQGKTYDEAIQNLREAVALHIEDETDTFETMPTSIFAMTEIAI